MAKEKNKKPAEVEEAVEEVEETLEGVEDPEDEDYPDAESDVDPEDGADEGSEDNENEGVDDANLPDYMKVGRDTVESLDDATKVQYLEELTKAMFGYSADFMNQADAFGARNILIGAGRARKAAVMFRKCVTAYRLLSIHVARLKRVEKAEAKELSKKTAEAEKSGKAAEAKAVQEKKNAGRHKKSEN